jgi:hypothetical protein
MNFATIAKLIPLAGPIKNMLDVLERLENDPEVKAAIATAEEVAKILQQEKAE